MNLALRPFKTNHFKTREIIGVESAWKKRARTSNGKRYELKFVK